MTDSHDTWNGRIEDVSINLDASTVSKYNFSGTMQFGEPTGVERAIMDLRDHFRFNDLHEERVRTLLKNDESLLDDINHLVIAASLMLSDASEMKDGSLRAYEMGGKIIIEERDDEEWAVARTIGVGVAELLAHARAQRRVEEIGGRVDGLDSKPFESDDGGLSGFVNPFDDLNDALDPDPYGVGKPDPPATPIGPRWQVDTWTPPDATAPPKHPTSQWQSLTMDATTGDTVDLQIDGERVEGEKLRQMLQGTLDDVMSIAVVDSD